MWSRRPLALILFAMPVFLAACASTTVKKNPGPHDHGVRYYRPKPYLKIEPTLGKSDEYVSITLEYLPDFSEEYSIHVRTGIGTNKTQVTLKDGWNLTQLNVEVDSKVAENLTALAKVLDAVPKLGPTAADPKAVPHGTVKATNVPIGYYEAVVSPGPDGKRRLYGWRYVGFMPYAQCPVESGGLECADCQSHPMFGLVFENGVMTFKPLPAASVANNDRNKEPAAPPSVDVPAEVLKVAFDVLKLTFPALREEDLVPSVEAPKTFVFQPANLNAMGVDQLAKSRKLTVPELEQQLASSIKAKLTGPPFSDFGVRVVLPK